MVARNKLLHTKKSGFEKTNTLIEVIALATVTVNIFLMEKCALLRQV